MDHEFVNMALMEERSVQKIQTVCHFKTQLRKSIELLV
jgi:hypothetical protein